MTGVFRIDSQPGDGAVDSAQKFIRTRCHCGGNSGVGVTDKHYMRAGGRIKCPRTDTRVALVYKTVSYTRATSVSVLGYLIRLQQSEKRKGFAYCQYADPFLFALFMYWISLRNVLL